MKKLYVEHKNMEKINLIKNTVIYDYVKNTTYSIVQELTNNQKKINDTVESISKNVQIDLEKNSCADGEKIYRYFGTQLRELVNDNLRQETSYYSYQPPSAPEPWE